APAFADSRLPAKSADGHCTAGCSACSLVELAADLAALPDDCYSAVLAVGFAAAADSHSAALELAADSALDGCYSAAPALDGCYSVEADWPAQAGYSCAVLPAAIVPAALPVPRGRCSAARCSPESVTRPRAGRHSPALSGTADSQEQPAAVVLSWRPPDGPSH